MNRNFVITISRGFGSGGRQIGIELANSLGIAYYENQILQIASEYSGINESLFHAVDEKLRGSYIKNLLIKYPYSQTLQPTEKDFTSDINLFNIQAEIIKELYKTESCVIVGKCADYVLRGNKNVINIYIGAPRYACIDSIMNKMHVSQERANELIRKTDKYRSDYYKYYTRGEDVKNHLNYDMVLNSDKIGRKQCVEVIKEYIDIKFKSE